LVWVVEFDPTSDGVLEAEVSPHVFGSGMSLDPGEAGVDSNKGKLLTTIAGDIGWLVKEVTGEFPKGD
jgi:hypothetical protein